MKPSLDKITKLVMKHRSQMIQSFQKKVEKIGRYETDINDCINDCVNNEDNTTICTGKQEFRIFEMINFKSENYDENPTDATWYRKGDVCSACLLNVWSDIAFGSAVFKIKNGCETEFIENLSYCVGYWKNDEDVIIMPKWINHVSKNNIDLEKYRLQR